MINPDLGGYVSIIQKSIDKMSKKCIIKLVRDHKQKPSKQTIN